MAHKASAVLGKGDAPLLLMMDLASASLDSQLSLDSQMSSPNLHTHYLTGSPGDACVQPLGIQYTVQRPSGNRSSVPDVPREWGHSLSWVPPVIGTEFIASLGSSCLINRQLPLVSKVTFAISPADLVVAWIIQHVEWKRFCYPQK